MPRRYYRKKSSKSRRGYRKTKFSKFNLYRKSGAKSQAMQIYSLNRKVNGVYKKLRQDIDTYQSLQFATDTLNYGNNTTSASKHVTTALLGSDTFGLLAVQVGTQTVQPDCLDVRNITLYINMRFNGLTSSTQPVYMRVVVVRLTMNKESILANSQIFPSDAEGIGRVRGPLCKGIKDSGYRILGDYKWIMTQQRPTIDKKIYIKGCRLQKGELTYPKNSTFICYAIYNPNYTAADNHTEGSMYYKIAYTNVSLPKSVQNAVYP